MVVMNTMFFDSSLIDVNEYKQQSYLIPIQNKELAIFELSAVKDDCIDDNNTRLLQYLLKHKFNIFIGDLRELDTVVFGQLHRILNVRELKVITRDKNTYRSFSAQGCNCVLIDENKCKVNDKTIFPDLASFQLSLIKDYFETNTIVRLVP